MYKIKVILTAIEFDLKVHKHIFEQIIGEHLI